MFAKGTCNGKSSNFTFSTSSKQQLKKDESARLAFSGENGVRFKICRRGGEMSEKTIGAGYTGAAALGPHHVKFKDRLRQSASKTAALFRLYASCRQCTDSANKKIQGCSLKMSMLKKELIAHIAAAGSLQR